MSAWGMRTAEASVKHLRKAAEEFIRQLDALEHDDE
jgi:hypothetical protein